ncbi:tail fibers protein [Shigella phage SHSML-45]|uniref:Tail fibers protein n=1 Tax=Shigella phage SHSML-45 TaxID=1863010 RepID=A0A193H249_9CAUD|nr:tail fiber protein [Shigella phage SHSML-45]ANN87205.1 tail fibers protein [Shigella phage SHSML-45]
MKKDQNLADVANINTARTNLKVDKVVQGASYSDFLSANGAMRLRVQDNNTWGGWNGQWIALSIGNGGTGAADASNARKNLSAFYESSGNLGNTDLNTLTGTKSGIYMQVAVASATPELNYPERTAGTLVVLRNSANSVECCIQFYYPYNNTTNYYARYYNFIGEVSQWTAWNRWVMPRSDDPFRTFIGLGYSSAVRFSSITSRGTSGIFADGENLNLTGSSFISRLYNSNSELVSQAEFRAGASNLQILNRSPGTSGGVAVWEFDKSGRFWSPEGITTATSMNWNNGNATVNRGLFMAGQANAPVDLVHGGIHVGYSNSYAMQIAARDNGFYGRCMENNSWKEWKKFALENTDIVDFLAAGYTADEVYTTKAISYINGRKTHILPATYGVLAAFGTGNTAAAGCYVGHLCWDKDSGRLYTRVRDDGKKVWKDWLKVTTAAVSDESLKDIKGNLNVEGALDNINRMEFKLFRYLNDSPERSTRRGVIAQQVRWIDREYTTKVGDKLHLDTTPMLLDGLAAIQALTKRDNENKEKISRLQKEIEELKAVVDNLLKLHGTSPEDSNMS